MKIKVAGHLVNWESKLSDHYKVVAGLLTFLHRKYPKTDVFVFYNRDIKIALDLYMKANITVIDSPIKVGQVSDEFCYCQLDLMNNYLAKETLEWELTDPKAIRLAQYFQEMMDSDFEWEDVNRKDRQAYSQWKWMNSYRMKTEEAIDRFSSRFKSKK